MKNLVISHYLPQFHPTPENDAFWGTGFTEWHNVTRARKLFPGHYQPHIPKDLGFYDLRVMETLHNQSNLASTSGISCLLFWHYWFSGKTVLDLPVKLWASKEGPSTPFALAWANQTWTGHWHGAPRTILIKQDYSTTDHESHFKYLLPYFQNPRYFRVNGRPLFYVFRPEDLPNASEFVETWQRLASKYGLPEFYIVAELTDPFGRITYSKHAEDGFDAGIDMRLPIEDSFLISVRNKFFNRLGIPQTFKYATTPAPSLSKFVQGKVHRVLIPNWDNTPRSGKHGVVIRNSSPELFRKRLQISLQEIQRDKSLARLLFIKSWNEWAEGNYLEPDFKYGLGYLEVLKEELKC